MPAAPAGSARIATASSRPQPEPAIGSATRCTTLCAQAHPASPRRFAWLLNRWSLIMQSDCNLVLSANASDGQHVVWASRTDGMGTSCTATYGSNGHLVIADGAGRVLYDQGAGSTALIINVDASPYLNFENSGSTPGPQGNVFLVDINGDGIKDMLYFTSASTTPTWVLRLADTSAKGFGPLQAQPNLPALHLLATAPPVRVIDINADGRDDLVITDCTSTVAYCPTNIYLGDRIVGIHYTCAYAVQPFGRD
jgi:hypothetical protein